LSVISLRSPSFLLSTCGKAVISFHIISDLNCYIQLHVLVSPNLCTSYPLLPCCRTLYHQAPLLQHSHNISNIPKQHVFLAAVLSAHW
jgi:hypothetical protein